MNLAAWTECFGVALVTAYRWFRARMLPLAAPRVGRPILVDEPAGEAGPRAQTAAFARVSSTDQKPDLDRQVAWVTEQQIPVAEVGSGLDGRRRRFLALLGDPSVSRIVMAHRDRCCRFGFGCVDAARGAQGRERVVVDSAELNDDLVRDMAEILTTMCVSRGEVKAA